MADKIKLASQVAKQPYGVTQEQKANADKLNTEELLGESIRRGVDEAVMGSLKKQMGNVPLEKIQAAKNTLDMISDASNIIGSVGKLPMDQASRMARAKEMGFGEQTFYHGTNSDIKKFDPSKLGEKTTGATNREGFHFASNPDVASGYADNYISKSDLLKNKEYQKLDAEFKAVKKSLTEAADKRPYGQHHFTNEEHDILDAIRDKRDAIGEKLAKKTMNPEYRSKNANVLPVKLKMTNPKVIDMDGGYMGKEAQEMIKAAKEAGHDGVIFKNAKDSLNEVSDYRIPTTDIAVPFGENQIRSVNAAFDPKKASSKNILAGIAGATALGAASEPEAQGFAKGGMVGEPPPEGLDEYLSAEQYGTTGQQIGTALEGAAEAATFGFSTIAERLAGVRKKDILARKEENPMAHTIGQIGGLVGSSLALPGGGAAGLMERAGLGVAEALGTQGIARAATRAAVESALMDSGNEISKMLAQDPHQTAQTALANVGLSTVGGALMGGAVAGIHPMWEATVGKKVGGILDSIKSRIETGTTLPETLEQAVSKSGIQVAPEVKAAMGKDPFVKQMFQTLQESSKQPGVEAQESLKKFRSDIKEYLTRGFGYTAEQADNLGSELSKAKVGDDIRESLQTELKDRAMPGIEAERAKAMYAQQAPQVAAQAIERTPEQIKNLANLSNEARGRAMSAKAADELEKSLAQTVDGFEHISGKFKTKPLSGINKTDVKANIEKYIMSEQLDEAASSAQYRLAKQLLNDVDNFKNIESLRKAQTRLNDYPFGTPEYQTAKQLKRVLRDAESDMVVTKFAESNPEMGAEAVNYIQGLRTDYAQKMDLIEALNDRLHVGKYSGPKSFYAALKGMKSEDVLRRLTNADDAELIQLLKQNLPETSELVRQAHLDRLAERATKDGVLDVAKLNQAIADMTPELRASTLKANADKVIAGLKEQLEKPINVAIDDTMATLERLNKAVKVGKFNSPSEFFEKLASDTSVTKEKLISNLSLAAQKDSAFLVDLQKYAPETFSKLQKFEQQRLLESAINPMGEAGERLSIKNLYRNLDAQPPEWRKMVLTPEMEERLALANQMWSAIPEKMNPSGTAKTVDALLGDLPSNIAGVISGIMSGSGTIGVAVATLGNYMSRDVPDAVRLALLKYLGSGGKVSTPAFLKMVDMVSNVMKGEALASKSVKALINATGDVLPTKMHPDQKKIDKLDKVVERLQYDQSPLIDRKDELNEVAPDEDMANGNAMTQAFGYLASIRPGKEAGLPFDGEIPKDPVKEQEYKSALEIAEQPLVVMDRIKKNTLTQKDVEHLQAMYPAYYSRLRQKVMDEVLKSPKLSYDTQIMLSVFLGSPLSSSLTPESIQATQAAMGQVEQAQDQKQQQMQSQALKGGGKSLSKLAGHYATPQQARQMNKEKT